MQEDQKVHGQPQQAYDTLSRKQKDNPQNNKPQIYVLKKYILLGVVTYTYSPNTGEAEAGSRG